MEKGKYKNQVLDILKNTKEITNELLESLGKTYNQDFEVFGMPNFSIHSIDRYPEKIRLFRYYKDLTKT